MWRMKTGSVHVHGAGIVRNARKVVLPGRVHPQPPRQPHTEVVLDAVQLSHPSIAPVGGHVGHQGLAVGAVGAVKEEASPSQRSQQSCSTQSYRIRERAYCSIACGGDKGLASDSGRRG
eukprot:1182448-Prorocentrum_minimum.AAC.13